MVIAWLVFPLVMLAVCAGCGLAVEAGAGFDLPGTVLVSVGLCVIVVVSTLTTGSATIAPLTTAAVVLVAVIGFVLRRRRVRALRPERWALAAATGVFLVCAAPVVLTGNATFLGYFLLNDGVFHFSLINQLLNHGHNLSGLQPSAYWAVLHNYLATSYPTGSDLPIGALRPLVGQDVAWLFQPYQAVIMALGAAAVYELLRDAVASAPLRAAAAFVAGQAGLVYAYYLEASIKEVATVWLITVTVVLVFVTLRRLGLRALVPLAIVTWAGIDVLDLAIAPWLGPPLAVFVVVAAWQLRGVVRRIPPRRLVPGSVAVVLIGGVAAVILIHRAQTFLTVAQAVLTQKGELGNLVRPLPIWEMSGIWPNGDFRFPIGAGATVAHILIGVAIASGVTGVAWAIARRRWGALLLLGGDAIAVTYLLSRANPYAAGKVMMIGSLAAVTGAMLGPAALFDWGRRTLAWVLAAVIAGGVLWTNALGYSDASVAPRARLAELSQIDARFSGQGPAFYNLSDEYATYFLRNLTPTDPALGAPPGRAPSVTPVGREPWDPDDMTLPVIESFRLLVIGNQALASRPPANYRLAYKGRFYDVWKRTSSPSVIEHIPLGAGLYPSSVPRCSVVRAAAAQATAHHGRLAFVIRPKVPAMIPTQAIHPPAWGLVGGDPYSLIPRGQPGIVFAPVTVPTTGVYHVVAEGQISQKLSFLVDGRKVGSLAYDLGPPGQLTPVGAVHLTAGKHEVAVVRPPHNLTPGDGGTIRTIGPVLLVHGPIVPPVSEVAPSDYRSLCGKRLDWIEVVR